MAERIPTCPLWVGDDEELLLGAVAVTAAELVHAAGGVDQLLLAREEGVRGTGDLKLYKRILLAVNFYCFARSNSGTCDERLVVRHVLETYLAVLLGMKIFFHFSLYVLNV